eukprot:TRINITY_DN65659_c0_g1_i1.p1 TRINITY_DN65659_c0_g1~~TRINITY_DN65659_c0_g1_i1.p1  ORF type:complete len:463 (-),score=37.70 TRINITY_DN65659_c0_g1_i1:105-1463(-)
MYGPGTKRHILLTVITSVITVIFIQSLTGMRNKFSAHAPTTAAITKRRPSQTYASQEITDSNFDPNACGVMYVAMGKREYIDGAIRSAITWKKFNPVHQVAVWTSKETLQELQDVKTDSKKGNKVFDKVLLLPDDQIHPRVSKLYGLKNSPFPCTLYMDADGLVCTKMSFIFDLLSRVDVAMLHLWNRRPDLMDSYSKDEISSKRITRAWQPINGGFMLYRSNPVVQAFLNEWYDRYLPSRNSKRVAPDQPLLHTLLWRHKNLNLYILPPEFNYRFKADTVTSGGAYTIHSHHDLTCMDAQKDINRRYEVMSKPESWWEKRKDKNKSAESEKTTRVVKTGEIQKEKKEREQKRKQSKKKKSSSNKSDKGEKEEKSSEEKSSQKQEVEEQEPVSHSGKDEKETTKKSERSSGSEDKPAAKVSKQDEGSSDGKKTKTSNTKPSEKKPPMRGNQD